MTGWLQDGRSLLGAAALCLGMAGCAAQHDDSLRLSEELGRARADAAWQLARAAELESRISRLEKGAANAPLSAQRPEDRALLARLDHMIELNERLLAERAQASLPNAGSAPKGTPAPTALPPSSSPPSTLPASASNAVPSDAAMTNQEQALRALVERMRGHQGSPHGGLSREQENALRVLTRPERPLDTENPWLPAFY